MIKATAGDTLIIGLSELNLERLKLGHPIAFPASHFQRPGLEAFKIIIMYGKTEIDIVTELEEAIDGDKRNG